MSDFVSDMFEHDNALTIYMYDPKNSDKYQTILIAKDIPSDPSNFAKCAWDSQNRNETTIVFQKSAQSTIKSSGSTSYKKKSARQK